MANAFSFYPKLEILRLDNNQINNILDSGFDGLRRLRVLNISCNRIGDQSIHGGAFRGIAQLEVFAIQHNGYTSYTKSHIPLFTKLRHLQVDIFNNFEFDESFLAFGNLKFLNLYPRTTIRLQNNSFSGLNNSQIENLDLSFPVLRPIGLDYLRPFHHLQNIRLHFLGGGSGIQDVLRSLRGLSNRNITSIDMAGNAPRYPVTLTDRDLEALGSMCVKNINLSRNQILRILSKTFWSSTASRCLEEFKMRGNNIQFWISYHVFFVANFENIRKLNVGFDPLPPRNNTAMQSTDKSNTAKGLLGFNTSINSGRRINYTFHLSETLEEWDGDGMRAAVLFLLHNRIHLMAKSLKKLRFGNTNFSFCEDQDPFFFIIHANITTFDMSGWSCINLNPKFLANTGAFLKLEILLARNSQLDRGLKRDKHGVFLKGLNRIKVIDISRNNLTWLHEHFFRDQAHALRKVFLDYNQFTSIPSAILGVPHFRELHFQYNSFSTFSEREMEILDKWKDTTLNFRGNLFSCTCTNLSTLKWILQNKYKFLFFDELMCQNGQMLHIILKNIQSFEIRCVSRDWLIISVSLFLIMSTAIVGTALLYRFRFKALFYFLQVRKFLKNDNHIGFKYDVFISYTPEDECSSNWTTHTLYPFLHNDLKLEVALEEKTFSPGLPYADNVHTTMEYSRKILVVFGKEFRKFSWSQCHLEMAQMHTFHKQRSSMVVIVLDDIPREELPDILRNVWWKIYFIYWPSDEMELEKRRLFWQQLEMVLFL